MALIHTHLKKSKPRKPNAKARELKASWEAILSKYDTKPIQRSVKAKVYTAPKPFVRETPYVPSRDTGLGTATKKEQHMYTGTNMIGISTLHKSNAVPVFSQEDAIEIARMRRG